MDGTALSDDAQQRNAQLFGGIAAAFATGGDTAATLLASNIALSGMANNRQLHRDEVEWLRNNAQAFADQMGISYEEALAILSAEAASRVDSHYASDGGNAAAAAFLDANRPQGLIASTIGNGDFADHNQEWFAATEYQYTNQLINFQTLQGNADIYQHLGAVQAAQGGDLNVFVATMVMSADVDDFANLSPAQTIAMIRVTDEAFATSQSLRDTYTQERYDLMIGVALDGAIGTALQVMDDAAFDALPQADRDYLIDRLVEAYYDITTTAPGGQADGPAFRSTRLRDAVDSRLREVGGVAPNSTGRNGSIAGSVGEANFAQTSIRSDRAFSPEGQQIYSDLAGYPIRTVDDLSGALRRGDLSPSDVPVDFVDMNGSRPHTEHEDGDCTIGCRHSSRPVVWNPANWSDSVH